MKIVNVLWTGGWDSTFRVLQLSMKNVVIQPYYLKDNRKSEKFELDTIKFITEEIRNRSSTRCVLNDLIAVNVSDVEEDMEIKEAYNSVYQKFKKEAGQNLGSQYEWLARFS